MNQESNEQEIPKVGARVARGILVVAPLSMAAEVVAGLREDGYSVLLTDEPEKVRILNGVEVPGSVLPEVTGLVLAASMETLSSGHGAAQTEFAGRLARKLAARLAGQAAGAEQV